MCKQKAIDGIVTPTLTGHREGHCICQANILSSSTAYVISHAVIYPHLQAEQVSNAHEIKKGRPEGPLPPTGSTY